MRTLVTSTSLETLRVQPHPVYVIGINLLKVTRVKSAFELRSNRTTSTVKTVLK